MSMVSEDDNDIRGRRVALIKNIRAPKHPKIQIILNKFWCQLISRAGKDKEISTWRFSRELVYMFVEGQKGKVSEAPLTKHFTDTVLNHIIDYAYVTDYICRTQQVERALRITSQCTSQITGKSEKHQERSRPGPKVLARLSNFF